jgi:hypothetical protein
MKKTALISILLIACFIELKSQNADIDSLKSWMKYIASDEMRGRENGSKESEIVSSWIARMYAVYRVQSIPGQRDFFQKYTVHSRQDSLQLRNVLGYIKGTSPDSFIVLSAHYDHIGISRWDKPDSIMNGADDDASGIVTLLAIAKEIQEKKLIPHCSLILAAFSGEEYGLLGSGYFCKSKIIPMQQVKVNLNFELVGRSQEHGKNNYFITGPAESNLSEILQQFNGNATWHLIDKLPEAKMLYSMADNYSFVKYAKGSALCIPAHTLGTSVGQDYIHQVDDEYEYMDFENLNSFIKYATGLVYFLSGKEIRISCKNR